MKKIDYSTKPYTWMRRDDRQVTEKGWMRAMLQRAPYGVLATCWQGQPFIHTNLFAYDEEKEAIYLHSALEGRRRNNIEANSNVCFSVSEMGRLLPGDKAMDFGVEYAGVVIFGKAFILTDPEEARRGLQMLLDKYFPHMKPGEDYREIIPEELNITTVYRIDIEQWSGKQKKAPPDFPEAFIFGEK